MTVSQLGTAPSGCVSIVIVNYNGAETLCKCLESVYNQRFRPIEVIVVDNGSTDRSVDLVTERFPEVHIIVNEKNLGFAEANNQGVARAASDRIVLLNNDTVVDRDWLTNLVAAGGRSGVGVVTSRVTTEGVPSIFYEMNGTLNYLGYNIMREFRDLSEVFFAGGASLTFSRADVGMPFPPEYFLYHEDVFLSWRMRLRGFSVRMEQKSLVHHVGSATTRRQPSRFVTFYQERNRLLNCLLFYERRTLVRLLPLLAADAFVKFLLSVFASRKSPTGILQAYWWCLSHKGWIRSKREALQQERKVPDSEILRMMSHRLVDADGFRARIVNGLGRIYANAVGLNYHG